MTDRLYRSPGDRVIAGVAGGMATWLNLDPSIIRVAWVLLAILSGGIFVLVYIVMMIVVPLPPPGWVPQSRAFGAPAWPGWTPPAGTGPTDAPGAVPGWQPPAGQAWGPAPGSASAPAQPPGDATQTGWAASGQSWTAPPQPWNPPKVDTGRAGIVFGAVLVLLGAWFLVDRYVNVDWNLLWPVVVIVLGVVLIAGAMRRGRTTGG